MDENASYLTKQSQLKVSLIQLNSQHDKKENLRLAERYIVEAVQNDEPDLIALPEMFAHLGGSSVTKEQAAENFGSSHAHEHSAFSLLERLSREHQVYIHGGSVIEKDESNYFNTTLVFNREGQNIVRYRKLNLFKTTHNDINYDETKFFSPGKETNTYEIDGIKIGCAICYDLRFSSLFQTFIKQQVKIIVVPSAFTYLTGEAHWELLCRARAIETQAFIVAPAQTGKHMDNDAVKQSWGHSMIVDPWGNVLMNAEQKTGYFSATLDMMFLEDVRKRLPVVQQVLREKN